MNTSAPSTPLTAAIMNAGTVSNTCTVGSTCTWETPPSGDFTVGPNQPACSNPGPVSVNNGGPTYAAGELAYNTVGHNDVAHNTNEILQFSGSGNSVNNISALMCITTGTPLQSGVGNDWDMFIVFTTAGNYMTLQFNSECTTAALGWGVRLESGHPTTHSGCIYFPAQTTHWFSVNYNMTTGLETLSVYTTDGTLLGTTTVSEAVGGSLDNIYIGNNENGNNGGTTTYWQNIMLDWTNHANPLIWTTGTQPQPPTNVKAATQ
jgi:hypothetical protein